MKNVTEFFKETQILFCSKLESSVVFPALPRACAERPNQGTGINVCAYGNSIDILNSIVHVDCKLFVATM